jgi:hypothetical protein
MLTDGGFCQVFLRTDNPEYLAVHALAFKTAPTIEQYSLLEQTWNLKAEHSPSK